MDTLSLPAGPDGVRRGFPVETPIGVMYLRHVGWGVLIDNSSNTLPGGPNRPYLEIHGKQFTASVGIRNDLSVERFYGHKADSFDDIAPSYERRITEVAIETAGQWMREHPELVAEGMHYQARMNVLSAETQVKRLEPQYQEALDTLKAARTELRTAERVLAAFNTP